VNRVQRTALRVGELMKKLAAGDAERDALVGSFGTTLFPALHERFGSGSADALDPIVREPYESTVVILERIDDERVAIENELRRINAKMAPRARARTAFADPPHAPLRARPRIQQRKGSNRVC
jgi:hypothetical protein